LKWLSQGPNIQLSKATSWDELIEASIRAAKHPIFSKLRSVEATIQASVEMTKHPGNLATYTRAERPVKQVPTCMEASSIVANTHIQASMEAEKRPIIEELGSREECNCQDFNSSQARKLPSKRLKDPSKCRSGKSSKSQHRQAYEQAPSKRVEVFELLPR